MYLRTNIKNNLRIILRDPTSLLSLLATIIMYFISGIEVVIHDNGSEVYYSDMAMELVLKNVTNFVSQAISVSFVFIGVIVAVDIFREKRNMVNDLCSIGQIPFFNYFISKIFTYYILGFLFCIGVVFIREILYIIIYIPENSNIDWNIIVVSQIFSILVMYTSYLWTPISVAVFVSSLTGLPVIAAIVNCAFQYIPSMFHLNMTSIYRVFFDTIPMKLWTYLAYRFLPLDTLRSIQIVENISLSEASFEYVIRILFSIVLLIISYFLLKVHLRDYKKEFIWKK